MNKTIKILLVVMLSILIILLSGIMVFFMKNDFKVSEVKLIDSYEISALEVEKIYLDLSSTDIEIKEKNDQKILVEYYSNTDTDAKIEFTDGSILLNESKSNNFNFFFFNNRKKVILYVPDMYSGKYELKVKSGDIKSEIDLSSNLVNITSKSGDVTLDEAGKINISSSSGDVFANSVDSADISTSSGDIKIDKVTNNVSINASSGDVNINKLDIKEDSNITVTSGDVTIKSNDSNCYVETDSKSGDVKINKSDRKSEIVLKIKTTSGDINVD